MIDSKFEYAESRWQDIYLHLKAKGFNVFSPGVKVGECTEKYVVVKNDGSARISCISSDDDYYSVMCYVPQKKYSDLEILVQDVKKAMAELRPMILPYGSQTPSFYDESLKAHMISIEYKNHKKMML